MWLSIKVIEELKRSEHELLSAVEAAGLHLSALDEVEEVVPVSAGNQPRISSMPRMSNADSIARASMSGLNTRTITRSLSKAERNELIQTLLKSIDSLVPDETLDTVEGSGTPRARRRPLPPS